jgi:TonB family protein
MKKLLLGIYFSCSLLIAHAQHLQLPDSDSIASQTSARSYTYPRIYKGVRSYMQANLKYPELAKENCREGEVKLLVSILQNGDVDDAQVLDGIGLGCDEEAVRLVRNMPAWSPAIRDGISVASEIMMTVRFRLL